MRRVVRRMLSGHAVLGAAALGLLAGCSAGASSGAAAGPSDASIPSTGMAAGEAAAGPATERLIAAAALAPCPRAAASPANPAAGSRLPALTLACLGTGSPVQLAGLRGPAVVNLWASWCKPCQLEMPQLQALHVRAGSRLLVLGVVTDDNRRNALSAAAGLGVHYPSVLDSTGALRRSFGYPGPPITLLVDRSGNVVHRILGPLPAAEFPATVSRYLGVPV